VAHPNYLVLAAILLPVGWLALTREDAAETTPPCRPWPLDTVVAPLLLFLLAVELVEHEPLRAVWEDAVAARLPAHASGLSALLLPRAGPELTPDPLGYLFGALAAGLGVVWIVAALLGASARWRLALGAVALGAMVLAPSSVIARLGAATGTPRAQEPWLVPVSDAARHATGQTQPAPVREARSMSFRRDPPAVLAEGYAGSPPQRALGKLLGLAGIKDPRPLLALALVLAAALFARRALPERRPLILAAALATPLALGTAMGSPIAVPLLALAVALRPGMSRLRGLLTLAVAFLLVWLAALAIAGLHTDVLAPRPGLGLPNILTYFGLNAQGWPLWCAMALVVAVAAWRVLRSPHPLLEAAAFTALALWLAPSPSPNAVALPIVLLLGEGWFDWPRSGS
jgi:hypothetical protein